MAKQAKKDKLNDQQKLFCQKYVELSFNGTNAAIAAGYSKKTAESQASTLLRNPKVQKELARLTAKIANKFEVTTERVILELARIAFCDIGELFDEEDQLRAIRQLPEDLRASISGVEFKRLFSGQGKSRKHTGNLAKVKKSDKVKALELLGRHLALFQDKITVGADSDLAAMIADKLAQKGS